MSLAFLFAGQGSQTVGMGIQLARSCADCRATLAEADVALNYPLTDIMANGPAEELQKTAVAQPALLALGVAHARHLRGLGLSPDISAGHSLGQYAALVDAGALDFASALRLVAARGRLMQETVPEGEGAMMAIVGLDRATVYACAGVGVTNLADVACFNAPGQTVISGRRSDVLAVAARCEEVGGASIPLAVSVPFHCRLLAPMVPAFAELVATTRIADPAIPVVDNVTALPLLSSDAIRRSLVAQVTAAVRFEETLRYLVERGLRRYVQCGPGEGLLRFAKRVAPGLVLNSFEQVAATPAVEG